MRVTIELDDDLIAQAQELTGIEDIAELLNAALEALVQREARRRNPD